jgi:hypothetical protein
MKTEIFETFWKFWKYWNLKKKIDILWKFWIFWNIEIFLTLIFWIFFIDFRILKFYEIFERVVSL